MHQTFASSALMLLVWCQEEHLVCKIIDATVSEDFLCNL